MIRCMGAIINPMAHPDIQDSKSNARLNWLRAAVLGANDGIVSVASIVMGVAGATNTYSFIVTAGVAGLTAGALSMAVGEYVSVSTQRDTEKVMLARKRSDKEPISRVVTHDELTNPWHAAFASGASFVSGGIVPLLAIAFAPETVRLETTVVAAVLALGITGTLSAHAGGANKTRATIRVIMGGLVAMAVTYGIGRLFGVSL